MLIWRILLFHSQGTSWRKIFYSLHYTLFLTYSCVTFTNKKDPDQTTKNVKQSAKIYNCSFSQSASNITAPIQVIDNANHTKESNPWITKKSSNSKSTTSLGDKNSVPIKNSFSLIAEEKVKFYLFLGLVP